MERQYLALNSAFFFWILGLIAWYFNVTHLALFSGALTLSLFIIHIRLNQVNQMFRKNKSVETPQTVVSASPTANETETAETTETKKNETTVIASDVRFEGNITSSKHVYVYGVLHGNIDAKESLIKVMRGGLVEGNITCRELIIDGSVIGQCTSNAIDIYDNGSVTGTLAYHSLSVKKGGTFSGQADVLPPQVEHANTGRPVAGKSPESADTPDGQNISTPPQTMLNAPKNQKKSQHAAG